jgi:hypothetical protein
VATKLVLLPGLDGTGELYDAFTAALADIETQVVSYPPDRELGYSELEQFIRERLPRAVSIYRLRKIDSYRVPRWRRSSASAARSLLSRHRISCSR